ncbi:MAG: hypothetical protein FJZ85_08075 [Chloroflexi bacterium]|nr:hypothetical protein [Chloroflexota bacterium]
MQDFLSRCPDEGSRNFFNEAITESLERGMLIYWGTSGFSLRAPDSIGRLITLFYGFPSWGSDGDSAVVQGYVSYIDDVGYREQVRQRFLEIPGAVQSGQYTVTIDLKPETFENAKRLLKVAWDVSQELSQIAPGENPQK